MIVLTAPGHCTKRASAWWSWFARWALSAERPESSRRLSGRRRRIGGEGRVGYIRNTLYNSQRLASISVNKNYSRVEKYQSIKKTIPGWRRRRSENQKPNY